MKRLGGAVLALGFIWVASAAAQVPAPSSDPGYDLTSYAAAHGRGLDQALNPDYQVRMMPGNLAGAQGSPGWERLFEVDPYVAEQGPQRADWLDVTFPNRYGVQLVGTMVAPKDGAAHPAIVIEPGGNGWYYGKMGMVESLAEAGYTVLAFEAQGDGGTTLNPDGTVSPPPDPIPSTPDNEYCRPYDFGNWQAGEGGVPEKGPCAGVEPPAPAPPSYVDIANWAVNDDGPQYPGLPEIYRNSRPRKAFGILDATRWLVSDANPWRSRVDADHIGVAGHSLGAQGALIAGQIDSRHLIDAVVAWDGFGPLDDVDPRVPTLFQHSESRTVGPHHRTHDPDEMPQAPIERAFTRAHVPTGLITLANATHQEWDYLPYLSTTVGVLAIGATAGAPDPLGAEEAGASSLGQRVGLYYTLAWFDRYLKHDKGAARRLTARRFDGSIDRYAIGQGTYDPATQSNVPYTIAGEPVRANLSPMFTSRLDTKKIHCPDLRAGCP